MIGYDQIWIRSHEEKVDIYLYRVYQFRYKAFHLGSMQHILNLCTLVCLLLHLKELKFSNFSFSLRNLSEEVTWEEHYRICCYPILSLLIIWWDEWIWWDLIRSDKICYQIHNKNIERYRVKYEKIDGYLLMKQNADDKIEKWHTVGRYIK